MSLNPALTSNEENFYEIVQEDMTSKQPHLLQMQFNENHGGKDCNFCDNLPVSEQSRITPSAPLYESTIIQSFQTEGNCGTLLQVDSAASRNKQKILSGNIPLDRKIKSKSLPKNRPVVKRNKPKTLTRSRHVVRRSKSKVASRNLQQSSTSGSTPVSDTPKYLNTMTLRDFLVANKGYVLILVICHLSILFATYIAAWKNVITDDWLASSCWYLYFVSVIQYTPTLCYLVSNEVRKCCIARRNTGAENEVVV